MTPQDVVEEIIAEPTPPVEIVPEPVVAVVEKPKWTLHVYNGNNPVQHSFEIEEEETEDATATTGGNNPLADKLRSLLKTTD